MVGGRACPHLSCLRKASGEVQTGKSASFTHSFRTVATRQVLDEMFRLHFVTAPGRNEDGDILAQRRRCPRGFARDVTRARL